MAKPKDRRQFLKHVTGVLLPAMVAEPAGQLENKPNTWRDGVGWSNPLRCVAEFLQWQLAGKPTARAG